jgi:hypothetical protein
MTKQEMLDALAKKKEEQGLSPEEAKAFEELIANNENMAAEEEKKYGENYVKALRKEAAEKRERIKELQKQLEMYQGIDVEEYKRLKEEMEKLEMEKLDKKGQFEKLKEQIVAEQQKVLKAEQQKYAELEVRYKQLEAELNDIVLANEVINEATMAEVFNPMLVKMVIAQEAKVEVVDGKRVIRFYDKDGQVAINYKTGEPLTVKDKIQAMKLDNNYAFMFKGGRVGAGSSTDNFGGANSKNPFRKDSYNLTEQSRLYRENPELAKKLKADADLYNQQLVKK